MAVSSPGEDQRHLVAGSLLTSLHVVAQDLREGGVSWALVGGLAVAVHGEPRFTRDIDVVIGVDDEGAVDRVVYFLRGRGYSIQSLLEHRPTGRLAAARMVKGGDGPSILVDFLFAQSGIEAEIAAEAEQVEIIDGLTLPVARAAHLAAMKAVAYEPDSRPQDFADLRAILAQCDSDEVEYAFRAVKLIHDRGFNRGKDLRDTVQRALDAGAPGL